jgi:flagellar basal body P-ring formation protein FlgA
MMSPAAKEASSTILWAVPVPPALRRGVGRRSLSSRAKPGMGSMPGSVRKDARRSTGSGCVMARLTHRSSIADGRGRCLLYAALAAVAGSCAHPAVAQEAPSPTPRVVIYPGDVIRDDMLADVTDAARDGSGPFVEQRALIVGKVARLTLLPGHAIPFSGVSNRKVVANGAEVKLIYSEGGLVIMTTGAALQDGSIGDIVRVRNSDSGVTVSGAVQPDGSVRVSGG